MFEEFWQIDFPALIIVALASVQCALLGSFLVLKKQAVMIDAVSHSVLPGIVMGAVSSGSLFMPYVMSGALIAALLAVSLVHILQSILKIEQGAAIGMVFTVFFASGVILLETQLSSRIHLDTQHVLYGALELVYWRQPFDWASMPMQINTLAVMLIITLCLIAFLYKELRLSVFDPDYARGLGHRPFVYNMMIMVLCALVVVSCFEAMGSILVIALFVCPAACARLLTNKMHMQLFMSSGIALLCAVMGYSVSALFPLALGWESTINSAALIAFFCGLALIVTIVAHKT